MPRFSFEIRPAERSAVGAAFLYHFLLLTATYALRPVRDAMAITAGGADKLPSIYLATFLTTLAVAPLFAAALDRWPRRQVVPWVYRSIALMLIGFWIAWELGAAPEITARIFFVAFSVVNLFVTSVFWSLVNDSFAAEQGKRLFGLIAAGGTCGAILGPLMVTLLVTRLGDFAMLPIAAAALIAGSYCTGLLPMPEPTNDLANERRGTKPLRGNAWDGLVHLVRSPYLAGLALTTVLYTYTSTALYFEQTRIVGETLKGEARTAWFASVDLRVNLLAIAVQLLFTGPILARLGVAVGLLITPLVTIGGIAALAATPTLAVLSFVQIARRSVHYALERPARETLYTVITPEDKYKTKNVIDTVIYRGSDTVSGWAYDGVTRLGLSLAGRSLTLVPAALLWGILGLFLARRQRQLGATDRIEDAVGESGA